MGTGRSPPWEPAGRSRDPQLGHERLFLEAYHHLSVDGDLGHRRRVRETDHLFVGGPILRHVQFGVWDPVVLKELLDSGAPDSVRSPIYFYHSGWHSCWNS